MVIEPVDEGRWPSSGADAPGPSAVAHGLLPAPEDADDGSVAQKRMHGSGKGKLPSTPTVAIKVRHC